MKKEQHWKVEDRPDQKTSQILTELKSLFTVWSWLDDAELDKQFPPPEKPTTRYFAKNVEADPELANKSAADLEQEGGEYITLRERLLLELQYFKETGHHLDVENWTLCAGSRYAGGYVPCVYWGPFYRGLDVGSCGVRHADGSLRARASVSVLDPGSLSLESRVAALEAWAQNTEPYITHYD